MAVHPGLPSAVHSASHWASATPGNAATAQPIAQLGSWSGLVRPTEQCPAASQVAWQLMDAVMDAQAPSTVASASIADPAAAVDFMSVITTMGGRRWMM